MLWDHGVFKVKCALRCVDSQRVNEEEALTFPMVDICVVEGG
jgi:hypothetical protein